MSGKPDLFDVKSLAFFGKVNASISHELKNIMAIISETAGLLSDLSDIARKGKPIELNMLAESTESIIEEIQRGFKTIRQMNRFSHSVDTPIAFIDLRDVLNLVRHLLGYLSFTGRINVHSVEGEAPMVKTCPFILQAIVYETVVRIFQGAGSKAQLEIFIQPKDESSWQILLGGINLKKANVFPDDRIKQMAESIGVSILCSLSGDQLKIEIPVSPQIVEACSVSSKHI